jgi:hypothetical protein
VESIPEDLEGNGSKGWTGPFGQSEETTLVPYSPELTSQVSAGRAEIGGSVSDTLSVRGGEPGGTGVINVRLYGPFGADPTRDYDGHGTYDQQAARAAALAEAATTQQNEAAGDEDTAAGTPSAAAVVAQAVTGDLAPAAELALDGAAPDDAPVVAEFALAVTLDEHGEAVVQTGFSELEQGGYYVYSGVFVPDTETQRGTVERFGEVSETVFAPWAPEVLTRASHQVAAVGVGLSDTLFVSGLAGHEAQVTATLWGPFTEVPVLADEPPEAAPVAGRVELTVVADGEYVTPIITVTSEGYYVWTETAWAADDGSTAEVTTPFGIAEESTQVVPAGLPRTGAGGTLGAMSVAAASALMVGALLLALRRRGWR